MSLLGTSAFLAAAASIRKAQPGFCRTPYWFCTGSSTTNVYMVCQPQPGWSSCSHFSIFCTMSAQEFSSTIKGALCFQLCKPLLCPLQVRRTVDDDSDDITIITSVILAHRFTPRPWLRSWICGPRISSITCTFPLQLLAVSHWGRLEEACGLWGAQKSGVPSLP